MKSSLSIIIALCFAMPSAYADVPANGWVVFGSNRKDGRHELYLMKADGSGVKRLTFNGAKRPAWSPDGGWIGYTHAADDSTHVMRHTGGGDKKVCDGPFKFWLWDGKGLVCGIDDSYYRVDPASGSKTKIFSKSDFTLLGGKILSPGGITHDGRYLVAYTDRFRQGFTASNGTFKAYNAAMILDLQNKDKLYYFGDGCEPSTAPTGDLIYHVCGVAGDCPYGPDPVRMSVKDIATRSSYATEISHDDDDWGHEYFPRISNDNKWMIYGTTADGAHDHWVEDYEIWIHRLGAGNDNRTRITENPANDNWPHLFVGTLPSFCSADAECDDGDVCTADSCAGQCVHTPIDGCCKAAADCGDGDVCTADSCENNKCAFAPISGCCQKHIDCSDGDACTADSCENNSCTFAPISGCCASAADCEAPGGCAEASCEQNVCSFSAIAGCCTADADCDDGNACTVDSCDVGSGSCEFTKQQDCCAFDTDCDDGNACTLGSCDTTTQRCTQRSICEPDAGAAGQSDGGLGGDGRAGSSLGGGAPVLEGGCSVGATPVAGHLLGLLLLACLVRRKR